MNLTEDPLAGIDAEELEADIDKAIDELFVKQGEAQEAAVAEEATTEEPVLEPEGEPAPTLPDEPTVEYLVQLKENLLTLDWEISEKNIQSFENELQVVSDRVGEDRQSMAVIKMALGVLQYLRVAKGSAAPISIQFLHAATQGLNLFGMEPAPSDAERNQVMDKLLGQFRRVKAEIQRLKPVAAPVEPAAKVQLSETAVMDELSETVVVDELSETVVVDELSEAAVLDEIAEEEPFLEEMVEEEQILQEFIEEEPLPAEHPGEEPVRQQLSKPEPFVEKLPEETQILQEIAEEEPPLAGHPGEETVRQQLSEPEPFVEKLPEETQILQEIAEEEPPLAEHPEEELGHGEPSEEKLQPEEPLEEERASEPSFEPAGIDSAPAEIPDELPTSVEQLTQEAREQISQLSNALEVLGQETGDFFGRVMRAMANKPALGKVERHFRTVHKAIEDKLAEARTISGDLGGSLTELEQIFGRQQMGFLPPDAQVEIDAQMKIMQDAVESFNLAATNLRQSLTGRAVALTPTADRAELAEDNGLVAEESSVETKEDGQAEKSAPLLEPFEEIQAEASDQVLSSAATIYLADVANHTLGIPTEAVANVFKVSTRKAKAFHQKGYVSLIDFKTAFRSIKRGITGPLAELKVKDLKNIHFPIITLSPKVLGSDDTHAEAPVKGIVLLSNGKRHGALFTSEIMQRTPYEARDYRKAGLPGEVDGAAVIEGDFELNVIDPDYVLSQISTG
jgi:hypothetical protein